MSTSGTIWFINAVQDCSALPTVCQQAQNARQIIHVLHRARDCKAVLASIAPGNDFIRRIELTEDKLDPSVPAIESDAEVIFLHCATNIDWLDLPQRAPLGHPYCVQPLVANPPASSGTHYKKNPLGKFGWRASGELAREFSASLPLFRPTASS